MKLTVCGSYDELSEAAAEMIREQVSEKPESVIGFATGSTPVGMYKKLIEMYKTGKLDMSRTVSFNLDEYYPVKSSDSLSYHRFMYDNFFDAVNIKPENIHIPNGETNDPQKECEEYEKAIESAGGIDIQILGLGRNGHIGFNEPADKLYAKTHLAKLSQTTIEANSRFFEDAESVPRRALTMGMASILQAKKILLLVCGSEKRSAAAELMSSFITTDNPATLLKLHRDVTVICDREAAGK